MSARWLQLAQPLPECALCEQPVRRETWERLGGLCSECNDAIAAAAAMLRPVGDE